MTTAYPTFRYYYDSVQGAAGEGPVSAHSDVTTTSPVTGEVLTFDGANWVNSPNGEGITATQVANILANNAKVSADGLVSTHSDVTTTSPVTGEVLTFDGTNWVNSPNGEGITATQVANILANNAKVSADGLVSAHSDVATTSPVTGEVLTFDGTNWINSPNGEGITATQVANILANNAKVSADGLVSTHSDVATTSPVTGEVLTFDGTNWVNSPNGEGITATQVANILANNAKVSADGLVSTHSDVTTTSPVTGEVLTFDGTNWVNSPNGEGITATQVANILANNAKVSADGLVSAHSDVATTSPVTGEVLTFDGTNWINSPNGEGITATQVANILANNAKVSADGLVSTHSDVATTSPVTGEVLTFDGTNWVNSPNGEGITATQVANILANNAKVSADGLVSTHSDVATTSPVTGEVLTFDGTNWVNSPSGEGITATQVANILANNAKVSADGLVSTHSDVATTSPVTGEVLTFDGTNWVNSPSSEGITTTQAANILANNAKVSAAGLVNTHSDVVTTSPVTGEVLTFDGSNWTNVTPTNNPTFVGASNNNTFNYVTEPWISPVLALVHITPLDTAFTTTVANQEVMIRAVINYERHNDGALFIQIDGVEEGSASSENTGVRHLGIACFPYEDTITTTMSQITVQYKTTIPLVGTHLLTFHARSTIAYAFALNRTFTDGDTNTTERAISSVSIDSGGWISGEGPLNTHNDVNASSPAAGDTLFFDGSNWINTPIGGVSIEGNTTNTFKYVTEPWISPILPVIDITPLDTSFATSVANQEVMIRAVINYERQHDGALYLKIDGVEEGSASPTNVGTRHVGISSFPYEDTIGATMSQITVQYKTIVPSAGMHVLSFHARSTLGYAFALNRTITDTNNNTTERCISSVSIDSGGWIAGEGPINSHNDVVTTTPVAGDVMFFDGTNWTNAPISATTSASSNTFNHVTNSWISPSLNLVEISPLTTTFATTGPNQEVVIRAVINYERHGDGALFIQIDGVEEGSASPTNTGVRHLGISSFPFEDTISTTMSQITVQYKTTVALAGSHVLTFHARSTLPYVFALNRTFTDGDTNTTERATSSVSIDSGGWVAGEGPINTHSDVVTTNPAAGDTLFFDGSNWINTPIGGVSVEGNTTNTFKYVTEPWISPILPVIDITPLDTSFATSVANQEVMIRAVINYERQHDGALYLKIDGVEEGSASPTNVGTRHVGISSFPYEDTIGATMSQITVQYKTIVPSAGMHVLSFHARSTLGYAFALNRTITDTNNNTTERCISSVSIDSGGWIAGEGPINSHNDVVTTTPVAGDVMFFDGSNWTNASISATTSASSNAFNHVIDSWISPSLNLIEISPLTTTFTTTGPNQDVMIRAVINYERHGDGALFIQIDGVEEGSASSTNTGVRHLGISSFPFEDTISTTMSQITVQYKTTVALAGSHVLTFHARSTLPYAFALNRTFTDGDTNTTERATSSVSVDSGGWVAGEGPINTHSDVVITNPESGQVLFFDGTNWVNTPVTATAITFNTFNFVTEGWLSPLGTEIEVTPLNMAFTTNFVNQDVMIRAMICYERHQDGALYLKIDGVEEGSSTTNVGPSQHNGMAPFVYDQNTSSSMSQITIQYKANIPSAGTHMLTFHARGANVAFALNRTLTNSDAGGYERGTSSVSIDLM